MKNKKHDKVIAAPEIKLPSSQQVTLTKHELVHLRDLLGMILTVEGVTISQALASATNRTITEGRLWSKVKNACINVGVPVEDDAPDYVVSSSGPPKLNVFRLEMQEQGESLVQIVESGDEKRDRSTDIFTTEGDEK